MKTESVNQLFQFTVGKDLIKQAVGDGPEFEILYEAIVKQIESNTPSQSTNENGEEVQEDVLLYNPVSSSAGGTIDSMPMRIKGDTTNIKKTQPINLSPKSIINSNTNTNNVGHTGKVNKLQEYSEDEKMEKIYAAIEKYSAEYNVDPNLVLAIIKTESNFNPNATSGAGAKGLMQLMDFNSKTYGVTDPFDIDQNIRGGVAHIREYLNMFDDNLEMALMAYNGGPGTMSRRGVKSPADLYKMPQETQNYVPKVMKYYEDYKSRC